MSFKVATRLRKHELVAQTYFIGLRTEFGWLAATTKPPARCTMAHR